MTAGRMPKDGRSGVVEARVRRCRLHNVAGCEADVLKGSRPAAPWVADPPVFYVARDHSFGGEGGAEMTDMRQVVHGLPETTMNYEEHRERSLTFRKSKLSELIWVIPISDPFIE